MTAHEKIRGILTPNIVPLDRAGNIHEAELRRYVDWLIERGVHGLYPNGSTGEFPRFTPEERRRIIAIVADQTAGRVPIVAGAAEANVRETIATCEYYHTLGVRAAAVVSPFYYRLSPEAVYAYFKEIADHSPLDITLYNIPVFASPIDVPTFERLAGECPRVIAIKDSSGDVAHMIRMIKAVRPKRPEFSFLAGWDAGLMPLLLAGCDGGTLASSGVVPEMIGQLFDLTVAGRLDEARDVQFRVTELFDAMLGPVDFPEGVRAAVKLRGFEVGTGRQPLSPAQQAELATMSEKLRRLLDREGYLQ